jgi:hypothetical protein
MSQLVEAKIVSHRSDWKEVFYINDDLVNLLAGD